VAELSIKDAIMTNY